MKFPYARLFSMVLYDKSQKKTINPVSFYGLSNDTYKKAFCIADNVKYTFFFNIFFQKTHFLNFIGDPVSEHWCFWFWHFFFYKNVIQRVCVVDALMRLGKKSSKMETIFCPLGTGLSSLNSFLEIITFWGGSRGHLGLIRGKGYPAFTFLSTFNFYYNSVQTIL